MDYNQSDPDFGKAISLYPPDHITYLNKEPLLVGKKVHHFATKTATTTLSPHASFSPWNPSSYDLQEILADYQSQPDLLQLILESKIQQDRRRTEEAQLRSKELDLILLQHHHGLATVRLPDQSPTTSFTRKRQHSSLFGPNRNDLDSALFLQQLSTSLPDGIDSRPPLPQISPPSLPAQPPSSSSLLLLEQSLKCPKSRKRREMQAITKQVETKVHDYVDGHFWRNNGNTIQKKTGNKSMYFKCANSIKGCPVNKTSTYNQLTGEYLIKYRGAHLPECGQIQHIIEV